MSAATIVIDGAQQYGSRVVTLNSVAYNAESIKITRPVIEAKDYKPNGEPNRVRVTADIAKLTMVLQTGASSTPYPPFGAVFTDTFDSSNYGAESFCIYPPEYDEDNSASNIRKIPVEGWKLLNGTSGNPIVLTT